MRTRLSRKESQLQTRERLLDAALVVFSRGGYYAASLDEIAAEAGYSKGAVYSNFSNKEGLFLALIDRRFAKDAQDYPGIADFMKEGLQFEEFEEDFDFREEIMKDPTWNILMVEFFLYAMREGNNRAELAARYKQLRGLMEENLSTLYARLGKKPMLPVAELPWSVFALGMGMMLQFLIEPEGLPKGVYERALQQLLK